MTTTSDDLELTWDQVLAWRVHQHRLGVELGDAVDLVGHLAGVQAQVASSAAQVLAVRGAGDVDLDQLLWHDRSLVRTWAMRGTLHLLPSAEWGTWVAVLRAAARARLEERYAGVLADDLRLVVADRPAPDGRRRAGQ
jgi:hypothetical protein